MKLYKKPKCSRWSMEKTQDFVSRITQMRMERARHSDELHVHVLPGNSKTGNNCWTVSLLPVIDCVSCDQCMCSCYDLRHDCVNAGCLDYRIDNSVIHKLSNRKYWNEIHAFIQRMNVLLLRINVGGDMTNEDFLRLLEVARENRKCKFLLFTKNYYGANMALKSGEYPPNVRIIFSAWPGLPMSNDNGFPEAHVVFEGGEEIDLKEGDFACSGNCTNCALSGEGCWALGKGNRVYFPAH